MNNNNYLLYHKLKNQFLREILLYFPSQLFQIVISKCSKNQYVSLVKEYYKFDSFASIQNVFFKIEKEYPEQIKYLSENILLPMYCVYCNGISTCKDINNVYYINDSYYTPFTSKKIFFSIAGMYYNVKVDDYYSFVKNFKLPFQSIKEDYITKHMPKLSKILKENNIDFSDFDYYRFHRDLAAFEKRDIRKQKLKFINIKNEVVQFFKKNRFYSVGIYVYGSVGIKEPGGQTENFFFTEKSSLKYVLKNFKFFMIKQNFTFHIFSASKDKFVCDDVYYIKEECYKKEKEKKVSYTYNKDGIEIIEYYNDVNSDVNPILTFTSSKELNYFDYTLKHCRLGNYLFIFYQVKINGDRLPKIFSYGSLMNI